MAGWDLQKGEHTNDNNDFWHHFSKIFSPQSSKTTSYKFALIRSILDNLYNVNESRVDQDEIVYELSFNLLFGSFTALYWNLSVKHGLKQIQGDRISKVHKILIAHQEEHKLSKDVLFEKLQTQTILINEVTKEAKRYVLGAVYEDSAGTFYSFDKKQKSIRLTSKFYSFLNEHKTVIMQLNNYAWAKFIEKNNIEKKCYKLLDKLEHVTKRKDLTTYRDNLMCTLAFLC